MGAVDLRSIDLTSMGDDDEKKLRSTGSTSIADEVEKSLRSTGSTSIADDVEKSLRSTGSTTAFASTCDDEEDIEPERCNHFMKQALQSAKAKQTWIDKVSRMREKEKPANAFPRH